MAVYRPGDSEVTLKDLMLRADRETIFQMVNVREVALIDDDFFAFSGAVSLTFDGSQTWHGPRLKG